MCNHRIHACAQAQAREAARSSLVNEEAVFLIFQLDLDAQVRTAQLLF
jgi:hypothetical protein